MQPEASVFIVEDEALIAMELADHLQGFGYRVCGKETRGEVAIQRIRELKPDVVLMDINLPGLCSGIETARLLGETSPSAVVFLSAYSDPALVSRAVQTGAFGYLVKPYSPRELHATIEVALNKHRVESSLRLEQETSEARVALLEMGMKFTGAAMKPTEVCPTCQRVHARDDWRDLEEFTQPQPGINVRCVVCPDCQLKD
jgi:DNA-binding NarL/FixJ family response regulator